MKTLETQRLFMRPMIPSDKEGLYELNLDPEVMKYTGDITYKSVEEVGAFIKKYDQFEKYKMGRFSVFLKETDEFLGWCGLKTHEDNTIDLGYRFMKKYWGKGYATESGAAHITYGFDELGLKRIIAKAMPENKASIRVMEKLGFVYFGHEYDINVWVDVYELKKS